MDQVESLNSFLKETHSELSQRLKEFNELLVDIQPDDEPFKKKLESALICWEDIASSVEGFKTNLSGRSLIKESLTVPHLSFLSVRGGRNRDSGIDTASSVSSGSPYVSSARLSSAYDDTCSESQERISFNLESTRSSVCDLAEDTSNEISEPNQDETSIVYIHILPTDPNTDLSALRQKIRNLSRSTLNTDNVELHLVPSDSFIGIPSRHSSMSTEGSISTRPSRQISVTSDGLYSIRARLPSSNDSLVGALMNMSTKIPEEHTDSSDDPRFVSSSDSEISIVRRSPRPNLITTGTQTDSENNVGDDGSPQDITSVESETY